MRRLLLPIMNNTAGEHGYARQSGFQAVAQKLRTPAPERLRFNAAPEVIQTSAAKRTARFAAREVVLATGNTFTAIGGCTVRAIQEPRSFPVQMAFARHPFSSRFSMHWRGSPQGGAPAAPRLRQLRYDLPVPPILCKVAYPEALFGPTAEPTQAATARAASSRFCSWV